MSSVQSFLKQRAPGSTLYTATDLTNVYVLVAGSGNVVGNYANDVGFMVTLATAGASLSGGTALVLRDMGKTVKASVSTSATTASTTSLPGFFRQVQFLYPTATSLTFGVNGQQAGTFPLAGNTGDKGFNSFYIPIVVEGVVPTNNAGTGLVSLNSASCIPGGSM